MRCFSWSPAIILLFLGSLVLQSKIDKSLNSLNYLQNVIVDASFEAFDNNPDLEKALKNISSPAVLLLNKHALKITLNFLCNVHHFSGVLKRLIVLTFDQESRTAIRSSFPSVNVVLFYCPSLEDKFVAGEGRYQMFQYFRAQLSYYLATKVNDFWMIQADTVWRKNLFEVITVNNKTTDLLFDSEGEDGLLSKMVAGGYFYVKSNERTILFFHNIAKILTDYFVTDNTLMTLQCISNMFGTNCNRISYKTMVNWRYMPAQDQSIPPFFQFDGGENPDEKFEYMQKQGALFLDPEALIEDQRTQCLYGRPEDQSGQIMRSSTKANVFIRIFHTFFEYLCKVVPSLETFTLTFIFPFYGYYIAV